MLATTQRLQLLLLSLLFCFSCHNVLSSPAALPSTAQNSNATAATNNSNYNCPADCACNLAQHTHVPLLHAKCHSLAGLKSSEPLQATLPIHSIDLSYLNLQRLSHALEKLTDVTSIDLSHNELHEFGHLGRRIKKLNLKHNRLVSSKLAKLPQHLQILNLQHNDITYLPLEFTKLSQLQVLELSHNSINCSCETLEVRNWLQERSVFMEHPVVCSLPLEAKGKPWLQVKQSDICAKEKQGWFNSELEENELMMGDQPALEDEQELEEEELGKAFLPIDRHMQQKHTVRQVRSHHDEVEGSGDLGETHMQVEQQLAVTDEPEELPMTTEPEEDFVTDMDENEEEEGSGGSGGGAILLNTFHNVKDILKNTLKDHMNVFDEDDHDDDNKPIEQPSHDIFGKGLGIFGGSAGANEEEEVMQPMLHHGLAANAHEQLVTDAPSAEDSSETEAPILQAKVVEKDDSSATYYLLGVIALIVVGLILFVCIKRCKHNRRAAADAENQRELQDMDKKNPGKPLNRNGYEQVPLVGEKTKLDMAKPINGSKPYDSRDIKDGPAQQPFINGSGNDKGAGDEVPEIIEPPQTQAPHEYYPITPRYPTPQSPRASKYAQHPPSRTASPPGEQNNNDSSYLPSSPKSGRYSPVYSPETGRVKIKLTETPKPKTPMLVTRSKSNAGDIITTPVHHAVNGNGQAVVH